MLNEAEFQAVVIERLDRIEALLTGRAGLAISKSEEKRLAVQGKSIPATDTISAPPDPIVADEADDDDDFTQVSDSDEPDHDPITPPAPPKKAAKQPAKSNKKSADKPKAKRKKATKEAAKKPAKKKVSKKVAKKSTKKRAGNGKKLTQKAIQKRMVAMRQSGEESFGELVGFMKKNNWMSIKTIPEADYPEVSDFLDNAGH